MFRQQFGQRNVSPSSSGFQPRGAEQNSQSPPSSLLRDKNGQALSHDSSQQYSSTSKGSPIGPCSTGNHDFQEVAGQSILCIKCRTLLAGNDLSRDIDLQRDRQVTPLASFADDEDGDVASTIRNKNLCLDSIASEDILAEFERQRTPSVAERESRGHLVVKDAPTPATMTSVSAGCEGTCNSACSDVSLSCATC